MRFFTSGFFIQHLPLGHILHESVSHFRTTSNSRRYSIGNWLGGPWVEKCSLGNPFVMIEAQDLRQYSFSTVGFGLTPWLFFFIKRHFFTFKMLIQRCQQSRHDSAVWLTPLGHDSGVNGPLSRDSAVSMTPLTMAIGCAKNFNYHRLSNVYNIAERCFQ